MEVMAISRAEVERLLEPEPLLEALAAAFVELSAGRASVPPRTMARSSLGLLGVMPGHLPGTGLGAKLVSVFPRNHERRLPSHQALIALFDQDTGTPLAVMDGTFITAARTAGASALATRLLARPDARNLVIFGAGVQGRAHLAAVGRVREFQRVTVVSRNHLAAQELASSSPSVSAERDAAAAVREADVVCLCTDASEPVISHAWLRPGAHVTSVGTSVGGPELDRESVVRGRLVVESRVAFQPYPAGSHELQGLDPAVAVEMGEVIAGTHPGRRSAEEITVYKSMGHAVEDLAAASLVYRLALESGAGGRFEL